MLFQYGMLVEGLASITTSGGITSLTSTSKQIQYFTGSAGQTLKLPPTTGMVVGQFFEIFNGASSVITMEYQDATSFTPAPTVSPSNSLVVKLVSVSTTNGIWAVETGSGSGGGGSKNYLTTYTASTSSNVPNPGNGNFELGATAGWTLAHSALSSVTPTSLASPGNAFSSSSGGSPASGNLSFATISSGSQIGGTYSGNLASSAASVAGDMLVSDAFFIDAEDQAKMMQGIFYFKVASGVANLNFSGSSANSFALWVYDVTNALWIQPQGVYNLVQNSGVGKCTFTFQTTSNTSKYQIALININASGGAYGLYVDDFSVGPQIAPTGPAMSDWSTLLGVTYPAGMGTVTSAQVYSRRVGDTLEIEGYGVCGTATASGFLSIVLPPGITMDPNKLPNGSGASAISGVMMASATGAAASIYTGIYRAEAFYDGSTTNTIFFCIRAGGSVLIKEQPNNVIQTNEPFSWNVRIPILGYSSNTVMSSDTDTRVVAASYYMSANTTPGTNVQINFDTEILDTHNAVTTGVGSWKFTVPVSGRYIVEAQQRNSGGGSSNTLVYKNGSSYAQLGTAAPNTAINGSVIVPANAGDTIDIRVDTSVTLVGGTAPIITYVSISRISGPAVIAESELVAARYYNASTQAVTAAGPINYDTMVYDTHGAVTTGASWRFTAPISGIYQVQGFISSAATPLITGFLFKNGSSYFQVCGTNTGNTESTPYASTIQMNAGDYLEIRPGQSWTSQANTPIDIHRLK